MTTQTAENLAKSKLINFTFVPAQGYHDLGSRFSIVQELPVPAKRIVGYGRARLEGEGVINGSGSSKTKNPTSLRLTFHATPNMTDTDKDTIKNFLTDSFAYAGVRVLSADVDHDHHDGKPLINFSIQVPLNDKAFNKGHDLIRLLKP